MPNPRINREIFMRSGGSYVDKVKAMFGSAILAYWPMLETSGAVAVDVSGNGRNGAYTAVALANTPGPKGGFAPLFDGATSYLNVMGASLANAFNGDEWTICVWGKVLNAGVWADAVERKLWSCTNGATYNMYRKLAAANTIDVVRNCAAFKNGSYAANSLLWVLYTITGSVVADQIKFYDNVVLKGTLTPGIGAWGGVVPNNIMVGAGTTVPANVWSGWLQHAFMLNRAATLAEITTLYGSGPLA